VKLSDTFRAALPPAARQEAYSVASVTGPRCVFMLTFDEASGALTLGEKFAIVALHLELRQFESHDIREQIALQ